MSYIILREEETYFRLSTSPQLQFLGAIHSKSLRQTVPLTGLPKYMSHPVLQD